MKTLDAAMGQHWTKQFPKAVQIETDSRCNSYCKFCPYSITSKKFKNARMSDDLFSSLIEELKLFQPVVLAPYMNNEPFIDKKIIDRIKKVREALPNTFIDIATNGSLLSPEISKELVNKKLDVNEIKINFPSSDKKKYETITRLSYDKTLDNVKQFISIAKQAGFQGRYRIILVGAENPEKDVIFWSEQGIETKVYQKVSRGGLIETSTGTKAEIYGCKYNREKEWMHILSNGEVVLCCMDWNREHILGNANESSLQNIWTGQDYQSIRKKIQNSKDTSFICNNCEWGIEHAE